MVPSITCILSALPHAKNKGLNMDTRQGHARGLEHIKSPGKIQCLKLLLLFCFFGTGVRTQDHRF
jgi:hypothetical protein